jgi:hypothetical protein
MVATKRMMAEDVVGYLLLRRLPGYPGADHSLVRWGRDEPGPPAVTAE